jgi:hypothetical protein
MIKATTTNFIDSPPQLAAGPYDCRRWLSRRAFSRGVRFGVTPAGRARHDRNPPALRCTSRDDHAPAADCAAFSLVPPVSKSGAGGPRARSAAPSVMRLLKGDERMALADVVATVDPADRSLLLVAVSDGSGVPLNMLGKDNFSVLLWWNDLRDAAIAVPVTSADHVWPPGAFDAFYTSSLVGWTTPSGGPENRCQLKISTPLCTQSQSKTGVSISGQRLQRSPLDRQQPVEPRRKSRARRAKDFTTRPRTQSNIDAPGAGSPRRPGAVTIGTRLPLGCALNPRRLDGL